MWAVAYSAEVAAALSGATVGQLAYWRSGRSGEPLLRPQSYIPGSRVAYSFQDVVALRTFVYLRARKVSLQRVRKAVASLRQLGEVQHLSRYNLLAVGRDVVWRISDKEAVALTGSTPGQRVIAQMVDILAEFANMRGRRVVSLYRPAPGVAVDPEVRGGYPVVEGTRIPYDLVASLVEDGVPPEDVGRYYPSVGAGGARGAEEFARIVAASRHPATAA